MMKEPYLDSLSMTRERIHSFLKPHKCYELLSNNALGIHLRVVKACNSAIFRNGRTAKLR